MDTDKGLYEEMAKNIANMSNKDAADILKCNLLQMIIGRGNGKSIQALMYNTALQKAIYALERMPDKEVK